METASLMTLEMPLPPLVIPSVGRPECEEVQRKLWTREEYYRLGEQGWFNDQRTELIEGEIIVLPPISHDHCYVIEGIKEVLTEVFGKDYWIRSQYPLPVGQRSEPQPDISVVTGNFRTHRAHPQSYLLAIEVSRTTLAYDLQTKSTLYAKAGVEEYWVVDVASRSVIVHREPGTDFIGVARYQKVTTHKEGESITPLAKLESVVEIARILPPLN
jgi:Uma2 family endonuclease